MEILPNWHPIFVHFTVALVAVSAILFLLSKVATNWRVEDQWVATAYWNLWIGTLISLGTVAAGWYAFKTVDHDTPSHALMLEHRLWALISLGALVVLSLWAIVQYRAQKAPSALFVAAAVVALGLVLGTAKHGGELVYGHGLGVKALPAKDDHAHAGNEAHSHDGDGGAAHHEDSSAEHHHDEPAAQEHHHEAPAAEEPSSDAGAAAPESTPAAAAESVPAAEAPAAADAAAADAPAAEAPAAEPTATAEAPASTDEHHDDGHSH